MKVEGHEQFAIRGVSAGAFVVQEHAATAHHFDLRLEVDGAMRSWAVPKGPSMDPAVKRLAVEVADHAIAHNDFEGEIDDGRVIVWDRGHYEQGGRVAWPEALERGHAVFVLHGEKLSGGFALQRTRPGEKPQWLLIKRRDEDARPGSDVVAERPHSVLSGSTLDELCRRRRRRGQLTSRNPYPGRWKCKVNRIERSTHRMDRLREPAGPVDGERWAGGDRQRLLPGPLAAPRRGRPDGR